MRPDQRRLPKESRVEMRKLIQNSTRLKKRTNQLLPKLTHSPRLSPQSKRNLKLLTKKSSKRPPIPLSKKLQLLKLKSRKQDLRKLEKERDVPDFSHQYSAHSRSNKN